MTITWRSQRRSPTMRSAVRASARAAANGDRHDHHDRRSVLRPLRASGLAAVTLLAALALAAAIAPSAARAASYNAWTAQTSGVTSTLYGVSFTDANNGWLAGTGGGVRHTTNGGATWAAQTSAHHAEPAWHLLHQLPDRLGCRQRRRRLPHDERRRAHGRRRPRASPAPSTACRLPTPTTAGSARPAAWCATRRTAAPRGPPRPRASRAPIYGIWFTDANNGWLVTTGGGVRHTTNGGTNWTAQTSGTTQQLRGVYFLNSQVGWVTGNSGAICHTTNGGDHLDGADTRAPRRRSTTCTRPTPTTPGRSAAAA